MPSASRWLGVTACLAMAGGCAMVGPWRDAPPAAPPADSVGPEAELLLGYLDTLQQLTRETPSQQAELAARARNAAALDPTTSNRLRYALILGLPGHPASDTAAAHAAFGTLFEAPEHLLPAEYALASVVYQHVSARLASDNEHRRLAAQAAREGQNRVQAMNRRLQAQAADNARLREELDEALAKLEGVAALERSLAERTAPPKGPPP